ncbi:MAG: hypothetical protein JWR72_3080 [Flavisolibacter sp.]|nr:hypothetical protein [Flavisolibacter sp.]
MKDGNNQLRTADMMLTSPAGTPYPFTIIIRDAWPIKHPVCAFEIKGTDPKTAFAKMCKYELDNREHKAYLDFFEKLSNDFGLRLPQNRKPAEKKVFNITYRKVLTENLHPGMIYGYGDPAIIRVDNRQGFAAAIYYVVSTSNDAPDSFPIVRSKDLVDWEFVGYVFPRGHKPLWASDGEGISDYWAPEMHWVKDEYRVYFVAREKGSLELCVGMARSAKPDGPFVAGDVPVLKGNVIDPHLFVDNDDTAYLYWKEDNNDVWPRLLLDLLYEHPELMTTVFTEKEDIASASFVISLWPWARMLEPMERFQAIQLFIEVIISRYTDFYDRLKMISETKDVTLKEKIVSILHYMKTPMFAQQLSADGSGFIGERIKILENDLAWEAHLIEGMWVTKQDEKYYLFYAGNDFSTSQYGIGVAIASSPIGPFRKMEKQLLQSTGNWWAPGHPSLALNPTGKPELFLHAFPPGKAGYKQFRALLSIPVYFTEEGVYVK